VIAAAQDIATRQGLKAAMLAFPGAATVYCHLSGSAESMIDTVAGMLAVVKEWNGNLVVERAPLALKQRMTVWGSASADALTQRVKQTFDAKSVLNPGRFVGGL
jgi:glycolate oxidase FAD binding subunit